MPKVRLAARKDANHTEIINAFRRLGWSVLDISQIPRSADLVVGKWNKCVVIEVKDGVKPPSAQKMTDAEIKFSETWRGDYRVINCTQGVIDLDAEYREVSNELEQRTTNLAERPVGRLPR